MNTQKKFLKVLSMLTIILLIATIFIPGNGNRNAVASIGILGILLLFLSTLLPKIYKLTLNLLKNQGKTSPWSSLKSSEPVSETEELLWRQISISKCNMGIPKAAIHEAASLRKSHTSENLSYGGLQLCGSTYEPIRISGTSNADHCQPQKDCHSYR